MTGKLTEHLRSTSPLILDGAMGTELQRRGTDTGLPMWSANALFSRPRLVQQVHEDYIGAGADIITTNTFRTTRRTMQRAGLPDRSAQLTAIAVDLALRARTASGREVLIAGSMAPLEDCYRPDLVPPDDQLDEEHAILAQQLVAAGVDFLLVETMNTIREALAAGRAAAATGKEVVVSFVTDRDGKLLSGESLEDTVSALADVKPVCFSVNCVSPRYIASALDALKKGLNKVMAGTHMGVYGNIGNPESDVHGWEFTHDIGEDDYAAHAGEWAGLGAAIIGGCCGTTPDYIRATAKALREKKPSKPGIPVK